MAKQKKQAVAPEAPKVKAPKHKCDLCGRTFKSALAMAIHKGQAHGPKKAKAEKAATTDTPVAVTIVVPRSKLPAVIEAAGRLGWVEVTIRF